MNVETLEHDAATSAENESSAVLYGELGHRRVLLTGDAGVHALSCLRTMRRVMEYTFVILT